MEEQIPMWNRRNRRGKRKREGKEGTKSKSSGAGNAAWQRLGTQDRSEYKIKRDTGLRLSYLDVVRSKGTGVTGDSGPEE